MLPRVRNRLARGGDTVGVCYAATNASDGSSACWPGYATETSSCCTYRRPTWTSGRPGTPGTSGTFLTWARRNQLTGQAAMPNR